MHFPSLKLSSLTLLLALAPLPIFAHPNPPSSPFNVTNLSTFEPSGRPGNNLYRVAFNVSDTNDSDSSPTFCEAQWDSSAATGYPSTYVKNCTSAAWAFKFSSYVSYYDFELDVRHTSKKHGEKVTRFAKGQVGLDVVQCVHAASGFSVCAQREGVVFALDVYSVR